MLTEEQIKNLKESDKLLVEVSFISFDENHDLTCSAPLTTRRGKVVEAFGSYHPSCFSLPPTPPKHDPCRKFRKGDKVRVVEYKGRNYTNVDTGKEGVVSRNETGADPAIEVTFGDDNFWDVDPAYLELVTPVEELEPYFVLDSPHTFNICKHGGSKFAATFYKDQPLAREHAEKYCADLNAEHRKEPKC